MMLGNVEDLFSVNKNSIEYLLKTIIDQRKTFPPITVEALKELMKVELREIPFDGTILEREAFIDETMDALIKKYVESKELRILGKLEDKEDDKESEEENNG